MIVVDDEASPCDGLRGYIEGLGHACRTAHDGTSAWRMHEAMPADLILSDWSLPGMSGIALCRRVRAAKSRAAYTYFILMSSFADQAHFIEGLQAGADDYHRKPVDLAELTARLATAARVIDVYRELANRNRELRRDSQRALRSARTDPLTNIANRLAMEEELSTAIGRAARYGHRYSLALCDVDQFKMYNDQYGHVEGDTALQRIASTMHDALRTGDRLFRYGGEEFVVLLPEQSTPDASAAMERMRSAVENLGISTPGGQHLTISIGVAEWQPRDGTASEWLARADAALYCAKGSGRNRVEVAPLTTSAYRRA